VYAITKRDAELAVLGVEGARVAVLRVPILCASLAAHSNDNTIRLTPDMHRRYGPTPSNADSAVNILLDVVRDQSGKKYTMDHYQTRFPTNVLDIAGFLVRLASKIYPLLRDVTGRRRRIFFSHSSFASQKGQRAHRYHQCYTTRQRNPSQSTRSVSFSHEYWAFHTRTSYLTMGHRPQVRRNYVASLVSTYHTLL